MGKCILHLDRETSFVCMKHDVYMCGDCLKCRDPEIYCKFRSSCPVWFIHKQRKREERERKIIHPPEGGTTNRQVVPPSGGLPLRKDA